MAESGLKCACGRDIREERVEEAMSLAPLGRRLLDGSRWLSLLVMEELHNRGVEYERMLIEQKSGGDEMDCFADISGELVLLELKDKEFSLGNAYSFGAKIGITRPQMSVIVTTAHVGGDAKDHFRRAELGDPFEYRPRRRRPTPIRIHRRDRGTRRRSWCSCRGDLLKRLGDNPPENPARRRRRP
jgi:hypothetical protein